MEQCKKVSNWPQFIPRDVTKKIQQFLPKNEFFSQVVLIQCMLVEGGEQNSSKDKSRYQYEGPSTRSKHWFALDLKGLENIYITREPEFISNFSNKII